MGVVVSVNVGRPSALPTPRGRLLRSAIDKAPVQGRVAVRGVNLEGDDQADRRVHGGPHQAVYAYASESYAWWAQELGEPLAPGRFGENLTTRDTDVDGAVIGERWRVGTALLEVTSPRVPCAKLGAQMGDPTFVRRFALARRPGAYLRIAEEGELGAGDEVQVVHRPGHGVTVAVVNEAYLGEHALAPRLLDAPELHPTWRDWALGRAA